MMKQPHKTQEPRNRSHQCLYKCRLCGRTFTGSHDMSRGDFDEVTDDFWDMCLAYPDKNENKMAEGADLMVPHFCNAPYKGAIGVADLLGIVPVSIFPDEKSQYGQEDHQ